MCLSETWLDDNVSDLEIHISNYCIQRKDRNRHGGGVCIYISQDLSYNERVYLNHEHLEATWIELLLPKTKPIVCASIYRTPNQNNCYSILDIVCSSSNQFHYFETI